MRRAVESLKGFLKWWVGELSAAFAGRRGPKLALVLTRNEIALIERGAGTETPLGVAGLDAPDRRERIEALRSIAERREGAAAEVELRLPRGQVFFTEFPEIEIRGGTGIDGAVAERCGRPAETLAIDHVALSTEAGGTGFAAAAVLRDTVAEALRHARGWGFDPVRVTSVEWPSAFPNGPELFMRDSARPPSWSDRLPLALGALALLAATAAGAQALGLREALARTEAARAEAIPAPPFDRNEHLRKLAAYSDAAAAAADARLDSLPMWSLLGEVARILPDDVAVETVVARDGVITLTGTGYALDLMIERMDQSLAFSAPRIVETSALGQASAQFEIDAVVIARIPQ